LAENTFYKKANILLKLLFLVPVDWNTVDTSQVTIDVIIPTIGRKKFLYDVLKDLSVQTHLPKNAIIVEQNPTQGSQSELDFINNETWPFTNQALFYPPGRSL
jgi:hypothetical protein